MDSKKALGKAAAYCSRQERCISDVTKKLEAWGVEPDEFGAIIEHLLKEKFIDEQRYALFYTRDKFRFNGWGKVKIKYGLKQKGIAEQNIRDALSEIDPVEYEQKLYELLKNKFNQIKGRRDEYHTRAALTRFAASKGYEQDLIYPAIEKLI